MNSKSSSAKSTRHRSPHADAATSTPSCVDPSLGRTVLLAVSGLSPAILTETVWALSQQAVPVIPDDVIVITTVRGREALGQELCSPLESWGGKTVWGALREELLGKDSARSKKLLLSEPRIIELPDPVLGIKLPASDLRSAADNAAAADFLLEEVRRIVENPETRLIASIAGGRKTMGALLYACMSLLGRDSDRLTHVLVSEPYDACHGFYYPTQRAGEVFVGRERRPLQSASARVELADIPFVSLRNLFARDLGRMPGTFSTLVEHCRERVRSAPGTHLQLAVALASPEITVNETRLRLPVAEYLLLRFLAEHAHAGLGAMSDYGSAIDGLEKLARRIFDTREKGDFGDWREPLGACLKGDQLDKRWVTRQMSSVRQRLRGKGGVLAEFAARLPERGRFSLEIPPGNIELRG